MTVVKKDLARAKAVLENSRVGGSLSPSFVGAPSQDSGCGRAASVASEPSKPNNNRMVNCRLRYSERW